MPVQKDTAGVIIELTVEEDGSPINLGAATRRDMVFRKPVTLESFSRTGVLTTDGADGKFRYTTLTDDLDQAGEWLIQADLAFGLFDGRSSTRTFVVRENL